MRDKNEWYLKKKQNYQVFKQDKNLRYLNKRQKCKVFK